MPLTPKQQSTLKDLDALIEKLTPQHTRLPQSLLPGANMLSISVNMSGHWREVEESLKRMPKALRENLLAMRIRYIKVHGTYYFSEGTHEGGGFVPCKTVCVDLERRVSTTDQEITLWRVEEYLDEERITATTKLGFPARQTAYVGNPTRVANVLRSIKPSLRRELSRKDIHKLELKVIYRIGGDVYLFHDLQFDSAKNNSSWQPDRQCRKLLREIRGNLRGISPRIPATEVYAQAGDSYLSWISELDTLIGLVRPYLRGKPLPEAAVKNGVGVETVQEVVETLESERKALGTVIVVLEPSHAVLKDRFPLRRIAEPFYRPSPNYELLAEPLRPLPYRRDLLRILTKHL